MLVYHLYDELRGTTRIKDPAQFLRELRATPYPPETHPRFTGYSL